MYTNCDELKLFLNESSLGRKSIEAYGHGECNVVYEKGTLKAVGYKNGKTATEDIRKTTGRPVLFRE